jgi:hypothetical protein
MVKASVFLGVNLHKTYCEETKLPLKISEDFYKQEWWENFMQVKYTNLLSFQ